METPSAPPPPLVWRVLGGLRVGLITLFVCWHLFYLLIRPSLDLWWTPLIENGLKKVAWWGQPLHYPWQEPPATPEMLGMGKDEPTTPYSVFRKFDDATFHYAEFLRMDQAWSMFTPPLARSAPFLMAELTFDDKSTTVLYSPNDPGVPDPNLPPEQRREITAGFIRLGGYRQRKLEDYMVYKTPKTAADVGDRQLWKAYVRWSVRRWRDKNPDDPREVVQVVLKSRTYTFPKPGTDPLQFKVSEEVVSTFTPDGKFNNP